MSTKVEGLDRLEAKLQAVAEGITTGAGSAVQAETSEIAEDWRQSVPVFEGHLQAGIQEEFDGTEGRVVSTDEASEPIEFGTSSSPAQPFAQPGADRGRSRYPDRVAKSVSDEIERAAK